MTNLVPDRRGTPESKVETLPDLDAQIELRDLKAAVLELAPCVLEPCNGTRRVKLEFSRTRLEITTLSTPQQRHASLEIRSNSSGSVMVNFERFLTWLSLDESAREVRLRLKGSLLIVILGVSEQQKKAPEMLKTSRP